jgi:hypothetical protein
MEAPNIKHQSPDNHQSSIPKHQTFGDWRLVIDVCLVIGVW